MTTLSRRAFTFSALSTPALIGLAPQFALATSHNAPSVAPQLFQAGLGKYKITALFDGMVPLGKELFFGPDPAEIDKVLAAAGISGDTLPAPISTYLLQSADRTILIDAGFGGIDMFGPGNGRMFDGLAALGVAPTDIDSIIVTHAHPDHIGGLIGAAGPAFANAEVIIPETEFRFWSDTGMMAQAPEQAKPLFELSQNVFALYEGRLSPTAAGAEVAPGITLELSPGHTPGHSHVHIDGGTQQLLMIADSIHNVALHTALPDIGFGFDTDSAVAAMSRKALYDRASVDNILIAGSHIHFPGFGRILKDGKRYRYAPASWL